jgi:hypothetical protein
MPAAKKAPAKKPAAKRKRRPGAGRPTSMTDSTIAKLEQAWTWGCSDVEACQYAGIVPSTLYRYIESHPKFSERKETLKGSVTQRAKAVVSRAIDNEDLAAAQELLKRKEGSKVALTGADGGPVETVTRVELVPLGDGKD